MSKQKAPLPGPTPLHNKLLPLDQLEEALREQGQRGGAANLGEILVAKGYLTAQQLAALLRAQGELVARARAPPAAAGPPPPPASSPGSDAAAAAELEALLRDAVARGASDVHVHAG